MKTFWVVLIICGAVLENANRCSGFGYEVIAAYLEKIENDIQLVNNDVKTIQLKVDQVKGDQDKLNEEFIGHKTTINSKIDQLINSDMPTMRKKIDQIKGDQDKLNEGIADNRRTIDSAIRTKFDQLNDNQEKVKKELIDHNMAINLKIDKLNKDLIDHKETFNSTADHLMDALVPESSCPENGINGVYTIKPFYNLPVSVYCDEGWIVIQRRLVGGSLSFNRTWTEYRDRFGNLQGEYWMGLEKMHQITRAGSYELLVVMKTIKGQDWRAKYKTFKIASEDDQYRLDLGNFVKGDAEDRLSLLSSGMKFSTPDRDNDMWTENCAIKNKCGWWFSACHSANLNGERGTYDFYWGEKLAESQMMIRAVK